MKNKNIDKNYQPKFEIVLQVRDSLGAPKGKTISYSTDKSEDLEEFFQRNCYREKKVNTKDETGRPSNRRYNKKSPKTTPDA